MPEQKSVKFALERQEPRRMRKPRDPRCICAALSVAALMPMPRGHFDDCPCAPADRR